MSCPGPGNKDVRLWSGVLTVLQMYYDYIVIPTGMQNHPRITQWNLRHNRVGIISIDSNFESLGHINKNPD